MSSLEEIEKQIIDLQKEKEKIIKDKSKELLKNIRSAANELAKEAGHKSLKDSGIVIMKESSAPDSESQVDSGRTRAPSTVEYRHPEDPDAKPWPGRGRKPFWLSDLINAGRHVDEFKVDLSQEDGVEEHGE